jgi:CHAT domain-containing protein
MLPLQAATVRAPDGSEQPLCAQAVVSQVPSAVVLRTCQARAALMDSAAGGGLPAAFLGVAGSGDGLRYALREVQEAATHFAGQEVLSGQVRPDALQQRLTATARAGEVRVVHLACHARALVGDPLSSYLMLDADRQLRLADLLRAGLADTRLAVLAACQTGVLGSGDPDQYVSLAAGFVQIGAAGVIATMRPVADAAAHRLARRFYAEWAACPQDPATALCLAQRALSRHGPGDWASFFLLGA